MGSSGKPKTNFGEKQNTNGFSKNPDNINKKGRPKKLIRMINSELTKEGYERATNEEIVDAILLILQLPITQVKEIAAVKQGDPEIDKYPFYYKLIAKELLGNRGGDTLERLLDRAIGKSKESIDLTTKDKELPTPTINITNLSKDDIRLLREIKQRARNGQ